MTEEQLLEREIKSLNKQVNDLKKTIGQLVEQMRIENESNKKTADNTRYRMYMWMCLCSFLIGGMTMFTGLALS